MKAHQQTIGRSQEWLTPRWILNSLGEFDLDPCASINRPWDTAKQHYTSIDNGLKQEWIGRVWCNPPFHRYERVEWMQKMAKHNDGIMLIPAACETKAFASYVWGKCSGILMLSKRPHFYYPNGVEASFNSGCTIALIAYRASNMKTLKRSGLGPVLVEVVE